MHLSGMCNVAEGRNSARLINCEVFWMVESYGVNQSACRLRFLFVEMVKGGGGLGSPDKPWGLCIEFT